MKIFAEKSSCPIDERVIWELLGKGYRDPKDHSWNRRVYITVWSDHPKWKVWKWQVSEFISKSD